MVISIEINDSKINIVQASKKGELLSISNCITINISSCINDGKINDVNSVSNFISEALNYNIKANKAVFVINSDSIITRKIKLPLLNNKKETMSMIKYELDQLLPVDLSKYEFIYKIVEPHKQDNNAFYVIYCLPLYLLNQYYELATLLKLKSVIFDVSCNCLNKIATHNLNINKEVISKDVIAIAEISDNNVFFSVLNKGVNDFSVTAQLNEGNNIEFVAEDEAAYTVDNMSYNNFTHIYLDETVKYIRFYQSINDENKINKLYVYGSYDNMGYLVHSISRYLKMDVENIKSVSNIKFNDCVAEKNFNINDFFNVTLGAFNDKNDVCFKQERNDILSKIKKVNLVALVFAIVILFSFFKFFVVLKGNETNVMKRFINDRDNIKLNNEIDDLKMEITHLENMLHNIELLKTTSAKEDVVCSEIFREIKYAMPDNTLVTSISVGRNTAQLNVVSSSMEEVTLFLNNLRNIEFMESIYVPCVEVKQDLNKKYSYSVVCVLKEVFLVGY